MAPCWQVAVQLTYDTVASAQTKWVKLETDSRCYFLLAWCLVKVNRLEGIDADKHSWYTSCVCDKEPILNIPAFRHWQKVTPPSPSNSALLAPSYLSSCDFLVRTVGTGWSLLLPFAGRRPSCPCSTRSQCTFYLAWNDRTITWTCSKHTHQPLIRRRQERNLQDSVLHTCVSAAAACWSGICP